MPDPTPVFPWSDLVKSEDGTRLTAPRTGLYVLYPDRFGSVDERYVFGNSGELKSASAGETRIKIQWLSEPIEDAVPIQEEPSQE